MNPALQIRANVFAVFTFLFIHGDSTAGLHVSSSMSFTAVSLWPKGLCPPSRQLVVCKIGSISEHLYLSLFFFFGKMHNVGTLHCLPSQSVTEIVEQLSAYCS